MHELSITRSVVAIVSERAAGQRVTRVRLDIGQLAGVVPEAVRFCFDICAVGTPVEGAALEIVEIPGRGRCTDCGAEVVLIALVGRCPACGGAALKVVAGEELKIREMGTRTMCATCGCGNPKSLVFSVGAHRRAPASGAVRYAPAPVSVPAHEHDMTVPGRDAHIVALEADILGKNAAIAERNRASLAARGILALNLVSSPGAGKTTLLERTIQDMKARAALSVIEGDQATSNDAQRIRATGVPAVQINTGTGCHLEADMLERALGLLKPEPRSIVLVENVGNLVCPALFDLGERAKVVIFSVTEGEDKPLKYPHMFRAASAMVLTKTDLLPHLRFDVARALANARSVNPQLEVFEVSAYSGDGLTRWYAWLESELAACATAQEAGA